LFSPFRPSSPLPLLPPHKLAYLLDAPSFGLFPPATFLPNMVSVLGFLLFSLFFLLEFVFLSFYFCFSCFFCLFRYTLWMMILGFHSNFPLHLSAPPISSLCSTTHCPLLGLFLRSHRDELSTPSSDFGFRRARDRLFFLAVVIRLVYFFVVYFLVIQAGFSFWCNCCLVFVSL
jgi:hypothetical protein